MVFWGVDVFFKSIWLRQRRVLKPAYPGHPAKSPKQKLSSSQQKRSNSQTTLLLGTFPTTGGGRKAVAPPAVATTPAQAGRSKPSKSWRWQGRSPRILHRIGSQAAPPPSRLRFPRPRRPQLLRREPSLRCRAWTPSSWRRLFRTPGL